MPSTGESTVLSICTLNGQAAYTPYNRSVEKMFPTVIYVGYLSYSRELGNQSDLRKKQVVTPMIGILKNIALKLNLHQELKRFAQTCANI